MGLCLKLRTSHVLSEIVVILGSLISLRIAECRNKRHHHLLHNRVNGEYPAINCRKHSVVLTDFGPVGDGKTSNTNAFNAAIENLSTFASDGGAQLLVPPGKWLSGSFNLISHFTLFLHKGCCYSWNTGNNGTIDSQGSTWWKNFRAGEYNLTRPYIIEIVYSDQIQISDLTLINSPLWIVHPIYSKFICNPLFGN